MKILCNFIAPLIKTLVIALHPDVGVDVKSDRVEFFWQFFFFGGTKIVSKETPTVSINELNQND